MYIIQANVFLMNLPLAKFHFMPDLKHDAILMNYFKENT